MMLKTTQKILGTRPDNVPADWTIYNAPRPMYGEITWEGDFIHGVFYGAIEPNTRYTAQGHKDNLSLDGWVCEYVTEAEVRAWAEQWAKDEGYDIADAEWKSILGSYMHNVGRVVVDA